MDVLSSIFCIGGPSCAGINLNQFPLPFGITLQFFIPFWSIVAAIALLVGIYEYTREQSDWKLYIGAFIALVVAVLAVQYALPYIVSLYAASGITI